MTVGTKKLIKPDIVLDIPRDVAVCPYCGADLVAQFSLWDEDDDGSWMAGSTELECKSVPDVGEEDWEAEFYRHLQYPYIYWLPVDVLVTEWVNDHYRFDMGDA